MRKEVVTILIAGAMLLSACGSSTADVQGGNVLTPTGPVEATTEPQTKSENETSPPDSRGILGMDSFALRYTLRNSPFNIPYTELTTAPEEAQDIFAYQVTGTGQGDDDVSFDYSLTLDSDEEVIGASFTVATAGASDTTLRQAASLYFSVVSFMEYDTGDSDTLESWIENNVPLVTASDSKSTTIGEAHFEIFGIPDVMYWMDISKVE